MCCLCAIQSVCTIIPRYTHMENQDKHAVYSLLHYLLSHLSAPCWKYICPKFDCTHLSCSIDIVVHVGICFLDKSQKCWCTSCVVWIEWKISCATQACHVLGESVVNSRSDLPFSLNMSWQLHFMSLIVLTE